VERNASIGGLRNKPKRSEGIMLMSSWKESHYLMMLSRLIWIDLDCMEMERLCLGGYSALEENIARKWFWEVLCMMKERSIK
jgi:hypothetical protein